MSQEYPPAPAPTTRPWLGYWPALVPLVACAGIWAVMRPDALAARPEVPKAVKWLIYDESDLTALALRGANAADGRLPGRVDEPAWLEPLELAAKLDGPSPTVSDRFYLEYPTLSLLLFRLGFSGAPGLPPAVADSPQYAVAYHIPRTDTERRVWGTLADAVRVYVVGMAMGLMALVVVVGRGYTPGQGTNRAVWLLALPGTVFFALNRFDVWPALTTAVAFACLGRGKREWAGVWFGVGVLLKVYPVLFVPVVWRYLGPVRGVRFVGAFVGTLVVGFGVSAAVMDWTATLAPIQVQFARPLETTSWTFYGRLLPLDLGHWKEGRLGILVLAELVVLALKPVDLDGVLRRCAAVLIVFVALAVFWSPQWMLWFLPLVVPLVPRSRWAYTSAVVALDLLNYYTFPILFWNLADLSDESYPIVAETMIYIRAAAWTWLVGVLVWDEWRTPVDVVAQFRSQSAAMIAAFIRRGSDSGLPRGLSWLGAEVTGAAVFVQDRDTGFVVALLPTVVRFEPVPGSDMVDVPHARDPRPVVALFTYQRGAWTTTGRAVFNLTPDEIIARSVGRYTPLVAE